MIRKWIGYVLGALLMCYSGSCLSAEDIENIIKEGNPDLKKKRVEWINDMHRCEPGIDWRLIEEQTRLSRIGIKDSLARQAGVKINHDNSQGIKEIIAGSKLTGEWIEKGSDNQAGRVMTADIDFERELIYLISAGGNIWKGPLKGNDWTCLNNNHKFNGSLIRLLNIEAGGQQKKRILVAESKSILYSDDEGATWNAAKGTENIKNWGDIRQAIVLNDEKNTIYIISNEWDYQIWRSVSVLYKSVDKGVSFDKVMNYGEYENRLDMWAPRYGTPEGYLIHEDTLFTIDADGIQAKYNECSFVPPGGDINQVTFMLQGCFNEYGKYLHLVMRTGSKPSEHFFVSEDMGNTWTKKGELDFGPFTTNSFRVSTYDESLIFYGGVELYYSQNAGVSWKKMNGWGEYYGNPDKKLHADIPSIDIFRTTKEEEVYMISTDGGLYISDDYLTSVRNISLKSLNVSQYYDILTSELMPEVVFAGSQDQGFQRCINDSGKTLGFTQTISGDYGHLTSSDGGYTLWCVYPGFAMVYTNATGEYKMDSWQFKEENWMWMPNIVALPDEPKSAYIAAGGNDGSYLWKLKLESNFVSHSKYEYDFGKASSGGRLSTIAVSPQNNNYIYALTNNGFFFLSTDKGESWEINKEFAAPHSHYFYGSNILPSKIQPGKIFIAGSGYNSHSVYITEDYGKTFIPADSGLPNTLVYGIAMSDDERLLFAATEAGPYVYIAEDSVWYDLSGVAGPDQLYWSVEYVPSKQIARFGTYGRGIWDFSIGEIKTGIHAGSDLIVPELSLTAAPAPFRDKLSVEAYSDRNTSGSVKVYDMEGRQISEMFSGEIREGKNTYTWNGRSTGGYSIPAGHYIVILTAGGNSTYKVIIKE